MGIYYQQTKHQVDKKVRRQDHGFSTILNYANEKIREIWMNMFNTTYNSTEEMINKLQQLNGKTKLEFYKSFSNYHDNMNISFDEDPFAKNAQGFKKVYHEVLLLIKFLQTMPQVKKFFLASLHPCSNNHPNRVSNYEQ